PFAAILGLAGFANAQTESDNFSYSQEVLKKEDCMAMETGYVFAGPLQSSDVNALKMALYEFNRGVFKVRFSSNAAKIVINHISYVREPSLSDFLIQFGLTATLDYSVIIPFKTEQK